MSGVVTMHPALSLVVLLKDPQGDSLTAENALKIVNVDSFKTSTGFATENGWQLRPNTAFGWHAQCLRWQASGEASYYYAPERERGVGNFLLEPVSAPRRWVPLYRVERHSHGPGVAG